MKVFRLLSPLLVAIVVIGFRKQPCPSKLTFLALVIILGGVVGYVITDFGFTFIHRQYDLSFKYYYEEDTTTIDSVVNKVFKVFTIEEVGDADDIVDIDHDGDNDDDRASNVDGLDDDLDNGKEFEIKEDGSRNRLKEVGTGRQLTMEEFHDSLDRLLSSSNTSCSDEDDDENSGNTYDIWISQPYSSVEERRLNLLRQMGLTHDRSASQSDPPAPDLFVKHTSPARFDWAYYIRIKFISIYVWYWFVYIKSQLILQ
ncbi:hypothetical protein LIER_14209 [Lithospermum erythrorhizon]|uniref:Uncharacterized protein n=1 Tax=Lithospermum erythrorhizon TaxID=34254 RepID=A0AAV3PYR3_LITER